jgi:hypothetical protein
MSGAADAADPTPTRPGYVAAKDLPGSDLDSEVAHGVQTTVRVRGKVVDVWIT